MARDNPCKECNKHSSDCHGKCSDYLTWSEEAKAEKERIKKARDTYYRYSSLTSYKKQF